MSRILKQILYGALYLAILGVISAGLYYGFLKPAPSCFDEKLNQEEEEVDCGGPNCADCALRRLAPISSSVQFFGVDGRTTIFARLQNPNLNYGASVLDYKIRFFDGAGSLVATIDDSTFIYPGEIKAIVIPGQELSPASIARAELEVGDTTWVKAANFSRPPADTREISTQPEGLGIAVTGVVQNKNLFGLDRANLSAVISNRNGFFVNASKTFVADLAPREERFFKIFIPVSKDELPTIDPSRTQVYLEIIK